MEMEHQVVQAAREGDTVGLSLSESVAIGSYIYKENPDGTSTATENNPIGGMQKGGAPSVPGQKQEDQRETSAQQSSVTQQRAKGIDWRIYLLIVVVIAIYATLGILSLQSNTGTSIPPVIVIESFSIPLLLFAFLIYKFGKRGLLSILVFLAFAGLFMAPPVGFLIFIVPAVVLSRLWRISLRELAGPSPPKAEEGKKP